VEIAYIILTAVVTAVATLLVQVIFQLHIVPRAEAVRRNEERWTAALNALTNLLTCSLNKRRLPGAVVDESRVEAFYDLVFPQVQVFGARVAAFVPQGISIGTFEEALAAYTDQAARTYAMRLTTDPRGLAAAWEDERAARNVLIEQTQLLQNEVSAQRRGTPAARPATTSA
jgi:hypothetical protein